MLCFFIVLYIFWNVPTSEFLKNVERDPPLRTPYLILLWLASSSKELMLLFAFLAGDKSRKIKIMWWKTIFKYMARWSLCCLLPYIDLWHPGNASNSENLFVCLFVFAFFFFFFFFFFFLSFFLPVSPIKF